jgi:hypothetical protein
LLRLHTAPQGELITAVLSAEHIVEIAGCGIFSKPQKRGREVEKLIAD